MITGDIKNKVDEIWEIFWTGGIANPLQVIEQLTYLLFIKALDDKQTLKEENDNAWGISSDNKIFPKDREELRWKNFKHEDAETMFKTMQKSFDFIKTLHNDKDSAFSKYMEDAIFMIPTPLLLEKIVTRIDKLPVRLVGEDKMDSKGDLYEYLLSKLSQAGTNGQFRTPRHIIDMMVQMMKPSIKDIIIDPSSGSAGFLVSAGTYLKNNNPNLLHIEESRSHFNKDMFYGYDMDRTMLRIGAMNMMLHGIEEPNITYKDSLSDQNTDREKFSLILANPPFKGSLDYDSVSEDILKITKTKKTELLFLVLMLKMLKPGGRCATIVPDGVLFGSSNAHKSIRKEIIENNKLQAIISMPSGVFKPYAGVSTAIMIFNKSVTETTDKVWFYDMEADGYSLDDKRQPIEKSDIEDIIDRFNNLESEIQRERTDKSFFVPKKEIVENSYDLSINRYKEIIYEEIEYEKPQVILDRIEELENNILLGLKQLKGMINE